MKRGPFQIAVAVDQLVNALFWGSARMTISTRCWIAKERGKWWGGPAVRVVDFFLGKNHCQASARRARKAAQAELLELVAA